MNLNGIEFYGRQLVIEEAKTKPDDDDSKSEENKENRNKKRSSYNNNNNNNNRRGGRGGYNNRGGRRNNQQWDSRNKNKYALPEMEADQKFHLIDGGTNLTNRKYILDCFFVFGNIQFVYLK